LFYALYKSGALSYTMTPNNLPTGFPKFNTNSFEFLIPALYFAYPGLNMTATFTPQDSPRLIVNSDAQDASFNFTGTFSAQFFVIAKNSSQIPVFTLAINGYGNCQVGITGNKVKGAVKNLDIVLVVSSSHIGNFTVAALQVIINAALNSNIVPGINNSTLGNGIAIPTLDGVSLVNPVISSAPGFFVVDSDFHYSGTQES